MKPVRPKKKLGQHFLNDLSVAEKIAGLLDHQSCTTVLEIGPGMGVLTQFLVGKNRDIHLVEIDSESIVFLKNRFSSEEASLMQADFLTLDLKVLMGSKPFAIIGNFPYNISSQIVFKVLDYKEQIPFFAGMFQKEVAERICEPPGSKKYGIISVLCQLYYTPTYLFTVPPNVFSPPPKVESAVLEMRIKKDFSLDCDKKLLIQIVKLSFQQRRKTLRNSLKTLNIPEVLREDAIFDRRPETLSGTEFTELTKRISNGKISN
jgi:16S rRNA (adenine1518-N6/adenine1519-N6)-dimethyltransferase